MIYIKNSEQIELSKQAGVIVANTLSLLSAFIKDGVTGIQLDKLAEDYIHSMGAIPSCKGYHGYPASICLSVNHQAVHCIPTNNVIKAGDVVKIDLTASFNGFNADSAVTVTIPPVNPQVTTFVQATQQALYRGILEAKEGNGVSDISRAVFNASSGFGVVKEFIGHGIGKSIHEAPKIPNISSKEHNSLLVSGMTICIEPIFTQSQDASIFYNEKQWDTWSISGAPVAHWEHTVLITPEGPKILTLRADETPLK